MNRLEEVRGIIDGILQAVTDPVERRKGWIHLYGVSAFCALLAQKHSANAELCAVAGMLHDLWSYQSGTDENHALHGAQLARSILSDLGCFAATEIDLVCDAIACHSDKQKVDTLFAEILKDADVLQHYLYNTTVPKKPKEIDRLDRILTSLGIAP